MSEPASRPAVAGLVLLLLLSGAVALAGRHLFFLMTVAGSSMEPTLGPGDRVAVDLWTYRARMPRPGEVVVVRGPGDRFLVKRVVAPPPGAGSPGEIWLLGDNRDGSEDSRSFGPVPRSRLRGRVVGIRPRRARFSSKAPIQVGGSFA